MDFLNYKKYCQLQDYHDKEDYYDDNYNDINDDLNDDSNNDAIIMR